MSIYAGVTGLGSVTIGSETYNVVVFKDGVASEIQRFRFKPQYESASGTSPALQRSESLDAGSHIEWRVLARKSPKGSGVQQGQKSQECPEK